MIGIYIETIASNNLTGEPALIAIFVGVAALVAGYLLRKVFVDRKLGSAQNQAKSILKNAKRDSDTEKKRRLLELKDEQHRLRQEFEKETREQRQELRTIEKRIQQREENLDRKVDILDKKEEDVTRREKTVNSKQIELGKREVELRGLIEEENKRLQRVSGMSRTEARELLLQRVEEECRKDSATMIRRIEADARERGEKEARRLIPESQVRVQMAAEAIQDYYRKKAGPITDKDVESSYDVYKVRQIMLRSGKLPEEQMKTRADTILKQARSGKDFEQLVKDNSDGPMASKGGEMEYSFDRYVSNLQMAAQGFMMSPRELWPAIKKMKFVGFTGMEFKSTGNHLHAVKQVLAMS